LDPLESIKQTFFQECEELLQDAEQGLLAMEAGDADPETINAVFRAVHSVKGGAGAFGLEDLIRFAHVFETVMDELRSGKMELNDDVAKTLLRAADILVDLVNAARDGGAADEGRTSGMISELRALIGQEGEEEEEDMEDDFDFVPQAVSVGDRRRHGARPSRPAPARIHRDVAAGHRSGYPDGQARLERHLCAQGGDVRQGQ